MHQLFGTVDTDTGFHGHAQFVADIGRVFGPVYVHQREVLLDQLLGLGGQRLRVAVGLGLGEFASVLTRYLAEHHYLGQGVGAQTVGAVQTDGGTLAQGVQTRHAGSTLTVGLDTTHGVVGSRTYRDRLLDRIHTHVGLGQLADEGQTLFQVLLAEVAQVEVNHVAHRALDHAAFLLLLPECLGETVTGTQLHVLVLRLADRGFRAQTIVLQIAVAILVDQNATFTATTFGHQYAGARQAGRVILNELHVAQWHTMAVGQGHAVTGDYATVGVVAVNTTGATCSQNDRLGLDEAGDAVLDIEGQDALHAAIFHDQVHAEVLIEALDGRILDGGLEQGVQNVETGFVSREPGAGDLHPAEATYVGFAVRLAAPGATPVLKLNHLFGGIVDEVVDHVLLTQPVATGYGVVEVVFEGVIITDNTGGTALCGHCVAAHRVDLGDQGDLQLRVGFCYGDCGTQATTTGTDDGDIGLDNIHICLLRDRFAGHDFALLKKFRLDASQTGLF